MLLAPPVLFGVRTFKIDMHESGYLLCKAKGYPLISFSWKFMVNNEQILLNPQRRKYSRFSLSYTTYDSAAAIGSSKLLISGVQKNDMGYYKCIATNDVGRSEKRLELTGDGK